MKRRFSIGKILSRLKTSKDFLLGGGSILTFFHSRDSLKYYSAIEAFKSQSMILSKKYRLQKYNIPLHKIQYCCSKYTVITVFTRWNADGTVEFRCSEALNGCAEEVVGML